MTTLRTFTVTSMDRLNMLQTEVPPQSYDALLQAAEVLDEVQQASVGACSVCDGPLITSVPGVLDKATQVPLATWRVAAPRPEHSQSASDSSDSPSVPDVEGCDLPPASVTDPDSSTAVQAPTSDDVKHTVKHLSDGLTDDQQNGVDSTTSDRTDNLLDSVGNVGNDVADTVDDTVGGIGSSPPTLP